MRKLKNLEHGHDRPSYTLAVDAGGTFTDFMLIGREGDYSLSKVPSTPENPKEAVLGGLKLLAETRNSTLEGFLTDVKLVIHGMTVADNALIQMKVAKTGLLCTKGFRDIMELREGQKEDRFNFYLPLPPVVCPRRLRLGIEERMMANGEVLIPLNEEDVVRTVGKLKSEGVEAIAVCLLHSYANPAHEKRIREIVERVFPEAYVSISSEVLSRIREYPRTSTTIVNACLGPLVKRYVESIEDALRSNNYKGGIRYVQSNGGLTGGELLTRRALAVVHSGPSTGPAAGLFFGRMFGYESLITVDMGGTSFDTCLVHEGSVDEVSDIDLHRLRIGTSFIDINIIGAGGGSIAWIDPGGILHVGPQSAGASPGPACYMRGGEEPAVTDANVVLGYFNPSSLLGGRFKIDSGAAAKSIKEKIAQPLNMSVEKAALGILRIANVNMARAIGAVSVERGLDPRNFVLVVGGACGPAHAATLVKELAIRTVLIPRIAPVMCAFGSLVSPIRHDYVSTLTGLLSDANCDMWNQGFNELERSAYQDLEDDGILREHVRIERFLDMKYRQEVEELSVPIPNYKITRDRLPEIEEALHQVHERLYTFRDPTREIELFNIRVTAYGSQPEVKVRELPFIGRDPSKAKIDMRPAFFEEYRDYVETPVYDGTKLEAGNEIKGPAIIEEPATTVVVTPGSYVELDRRDVYVLTSEK